MIKEKRFPTIIGLIVLILAIIVGVYLTGSKTNLGSKASGDCKPINIQVANITYNSADISFTTAIECLSSLSINNQIIEDVRFLNTNQTPSATKIHYFQPKNLNANSAYKFLLISGGESIIRDDYVFTTGFKPNSSLPTSNLAWGRVLNSDGKTTGSAIVYLNIPGASPLSSFVTSNGNWSISLASSFNTANDDWFTPPSSPVEEDIVVIAEDGTVTQVTNNTGLNNPVPDIIIGQNSLTVPPDYQSTNQGIFESASPIQSQKDINITNPSDGQTLNVNRPDFFGTGPINSSIIIEVNSETPVIGQVQTDSSGAWNWSPPQNLAPGDHTITAKVQDPATGLWKSVTKKFTVLAQSDDLPAYEASGSATITPITTPTIVPTIIPTTIPTLEPTIEPTATPTEIIRVAHPSSTSTKPPVSGNILPTTLIIMSALILFFVSFKFIK